MKNGFTLIELLAVIVVLAIIALIATPIVLNIINNAKDSANKRSVELYCSAVKNAIIMKSIEMDVPSGTYTTLDSHKFIINNEEMSIDYEGNDVNCTLEIEENGNIKLTNCKVDNVSIDYGCNNGEVVVDDEDTDSNICTLISGTSKERGAKYSCQVNSTKSFNFYVLSENSDNSINLIMERNICKDGTVALDGVQYITSGNPTEEGENCFSAWISEEDYLSAGVTSQDWNNNIRNNKGPLTALNHLKQATSSWNYITYNYGTLTDELENYSEISLSEYHARLPYFYDIFNYTYNDLMNKYTKGEIDLNWFVSHATTNYYVYDYLADFTCDDDCVFSQQVRSNMSFVNDMEGYWIASSDNDGYSSMFIPNEGSTGSVGVNWNITYGIRPVITVNKNQLN